MQDETATPTRYVLPTPDITRAHPSAAALLSRCFAGKNTHDVAGFLASFAQDMSSYNDATLGWKVPGWQPLHDLLGQYMPNWSSGVSYPTRILAGPTSALVAVTDTPELFGGEIHALACVDFRDGAIVRWIDYWDSASFDPSVIAAMTAHVESYPEELGEGEIDQAADPTIVTACTRFHEALADDVGAVADLLTYDVVYEDMAARVQLIGRSAVSRYLARAIGLVPFGPGAAILHIVGGAAGGGYEWTGAHDSGIPRGVSALELDASGSISRVTSVCDSVRLGAVRCTALRDAAGE